MAKKKKKKETQRKSKLEFTWKNWTLFGVSILSILVGYIYLARGSITLAPILLVAGYVVLLPLSLVIDQLKEWTGKTS
ncbi:hypothetical protein DRQ16_03650 [bacterium]|nr:MAG: hypothetical protein DRQ16_03650 [bacterium]